MRTNLLLAIHEKANRILNSDADWETKYDLIFSDTISKLVFDELNLEYCDPDTSYEEDVRAFMNAFNSKMEETKKTL